MTTAELMLPEAAELEEPDAGAAVACDAETAARIAADALDCAERVILRHVEMPTQAALDTVLLWCLHACARERDDPGKAGPLYLPASPRLMVTAATRGAGKSTLLNLVALLTGARGRTTKITPSAFADKMSKFQVTVALDEARLMFGAGQQSQDLQAMLIDGYTPMSSYVLAGEDKNLFGAVAYAGKDNLIARAGEAVQDLLDRTIILRLAPAGAFYPDIDEDAVKLAELAHRGMAAWCMVRRDDILAACKAIARETAAMGGKPVRGAARKAQIWRPLLAIADALGGDWPERARAARDELNLPVTGAQATAWSAAISDITVSLDAARQGPVFAEALRHPPTPDLATLLGDIREVFDGDRMRSEDLTAALRARRAMWDGQWDGVAERDMAGMLRQVGIEPRPMRINGTLARGYERAWFSQERDAL
jgi:hypothetical protein